MSCGRCSLPSDLRAWGASQGAPCRSTDKETAVRRLDPYQERARQLCLAAGVDPDSRVGEGRGQPAWCLYRDAARKEHLGREAAATAAEIVNLRPQEDHFKD